MPIQIGTDTAKTRRKLSAGGKEYAYYSIAAATEAGYTIDWRQFSSGGDISTALASGNVAVGVLGSTGTTAAVTRGVDLQLFWILDDIGRSEALVARQGSGIESPADLKGKRVGVPFVSTSLPTVSWKPSRNLVVIWMRPLKRN